MSSPSTNPLLSRARLSCFPITDNGIRALLSALELEHGAQQTAELLANFVRVGPNATEENKIDIVKKYILSMSQWEPSILQFERQKNLRTNLGKQILLTNPELPSKIHEQVLQQQEQAAGGGKSTYFSSSRPKSSYEFDFASCQLPNSTPVIPDIENEVSLVEVMTAFYEKYTILFCDLKESEKASMMKVQIKRKDGSFFALTRNELDQYATNYRKALQSYSQISGHLIPEARTKIAENSDFWTFIWPSSSVSKASGQSLFAPTIVALQRKLFAPATVSEEHIYNELSAKHVELLTLWSKVKSK